MRRIAGRVQPLREERVDGRSIRTVSWVQATLGFLRAVRLGRGVLRRVWTGAAARGASAGQPQVRQDGQGQGLERGAAEALAATFAEARNGHNLDARTGRFDTPIAVELRGGAGARERGFEA